MNVSKICFICCVNDQELYSIAKSSIESLYVPDGIEIDIVSVENASSITSGYNSAMGNSDAKYKVYIHQDVRIVNEQFIPDLIALFSSSPSLGMIGMVGAKTLPQSGVWWEAGHMFGSVVESHTGVLQHLSFQPPSGTYESVEALDGLLLATQYDIPWREDLLKGWHFYDASQCQEFIYNGYDVGIPQQLQPWCIHDCGIVNTANGFHQDAAIFRNEYGLGQTLYNHLFYKVGRHCQIDPSCDLYATEGVSIGDKVKLQKDCWVMLPYNNYHGEPRIVIGAGSDIGRRCNLSAVNSITIGREVIIAPNVHITDHNHAYQHVPIPIMKQGIDSWHHRVEIGDGCWLGINVVIAGNVKIGKGCVIGANSVVVSGTVIPDYCVVAGTPAKVVKQFNKETGQWERVRQAQNIQQVEQAVNVAQAVEVYQEAHKEVIQKVRQEARELISLREHAESISTEAPLLSICIPTYNRADNLKECLESIYSQIGDDPRFEVIVCDNCSTDHTLQLLQDYEQRHASFSFSQNAENIGADRNIYHVMTLGTGEFIMPHGDDYYLPGTLSLICNLVLKHRDCSVIFLDVLKGDGIIHQGKGLNEYLAKVSIYSTFISGLILRRRELSQIESPQLFMESHLNQVYLQYAILNLEPKFCVYHQRLFSSAGNMSGGYSFAQIFITNYLDILDYFSDRGLDSAIIAMEKQRLVPSFFIWWYDHMLSNRLAQLQPETFEDTFIAAYGQESYFPNAYEQITAIRRKYESPPIL
jgi:abequosyltransferase